YFQICVLFIACLVSLINGDASSSTTGPGYVVVPLIQCQEGPCVPGQCINVTEEQCAEQNKKYMAIEPDCTCCSYCF
ncbi:hypothetical protein C0J52_23109, partial [Blattella germanica]